MLARGLGRWASQLGPAAAAGATAAPAASLGGNLARSQPLWAAASRALSVLLSSRDGKGEHAAGGGASSGSWLLRGAATALTAISLTTASHAVLCPGCPGCPYP